MNIPGLRKKLNQRIKEIDNVWETWRAHYQDIRDYIAPEHGYALDDQDASDQQDGKKKHSYIIDDTACDALDVLAAGLHSGLTSPARPWFDLGPEDPDLEENKAVMSWLHDVQEIMQTVFARSNVYNVLHHTYRELGAFGTGAMMVMEDFRNTIHCRALTAGEYKLALNHKGEVDTVYRMLRMTARQMKQRWGEDKLSQGVKSAADRNPDQEYVVIQLIEPNDDRIEIRDPMNRRYRSIYMEKNASEDMVLEVSGYDEFPVMAPRWFVVGQQTYGRSRGMRALADTKMLQKLHKDSLLAIDKHNNPPMQAPGTLKTTNINALPGGVSYTDSQGAGGAKPMITPLYQTQPDVQGLEFKITQTQERIKRAFLYQLFLMLANMDNREMTAREINERHEEKLLMIGPALNKLFSELLDKLIDRVFAICDRAGLFPPAPPQLEGQELKVEYISNLAQAQKMVSAYAIEELTNYVGAVAAVDPSALDNVDLDEAVREIAKIKGVNPKILRDPDMIAQMRAARQQQQQAAQALEAAEQASSVAKNLGSTEVGEGTALDAVMGRPI